MVLRVRYHFLSVGFDSWLESLYLTHNTEAAESKSAKLFRSHSIGTVTFSVEGLENNLSFSIQKQYGNLTGATGKNTIQNFINAMRSRDSNVYHLSFSKQ